MEETLTKLESQLVGFFKQFTKKNIDERTSVNNDLELLVSEVPLIIQFLKEKGVEVQQEDLESFFLSEFNIPFQYSFYKLFRSQKLKRPPLTISHLAIVCQKGKWFDPVVM